MHLDTSFLVDLLRESRRGTGGPATRLLDQYSEEEIRVSVHALCELYAGVELSSRSAEERRAVETLATGFEVVYPGPAFAPTYGRLLAPLQAAGALVSAMDLLIATAAVVDDAPLVTGNRRHFERIGGLEVIGY